MSAYWLVGRVVAGSLVVLSACIERNPEAAPLDADSIRVANSGDRVWQAFHVEVMHPPQVVQLPEERSLVYELHLTNFARTPLAIRQVEVLEESGRRIAEIGGSALEAIIARPGVAADTSRRAISPGHRAIIYLNVPVNGDPRRIRHRITIDNGVNGATAQTAVIESSETAVTAGAVLRLGPPLRGGPWVAVYEPRLERGHRRVVYAVNGRARIPGRFAIDWMKPITPADAGQTSGANASSGYGEEVLAVADAVVAAARDDVAEADESGTAGALPLGDGSGNYIALDVGDGTYVFYEHLKPGILVRPEERVRRGQVIGYVGASGHVTRPHLHLHVSNALSPLAAEGRPFVLENLEILGEYESIQAFGGGELWRAHRGRREGMEAFFPSPNLVVAFPES